MSDVVKVGRPLGSGKLGIQRKDNYKEYDKEYQKRYRYIFSINLNQETDNDIIEAIETLHGGNRQKAVKDLIRAGIKYNSLETKQDD